MMILNIRNTEYELTLEDNSTITIKRHGYMKKDAIRQSHHLSQDAAFKKVIPREEGLAIDLDGNIFNQRYFPCGWNETYPEGKIIIF